MNRKRRKEWAGALAACFALAAVMLLFVSQSSPLYPINDWADANCLLTVGRVMRAGGVVYRDIYEQKGATLYLLHALAACISDSSFLGVYAMETLSLTAALFAAYRLLRLRAGKAWAMGGVAAWGALVLISPSFCKGDSAEEFCLPLLMVAMAVAYAEYGRRAKPMRPAWLALCGLMAGILFTIKYTLLGAMLGLCLCEGVLAVRTGGMRRALKSAGVFLAGMLLPVLLWAVYFAANDALGDAVTAYLTNNIFLYSDETLTLAERIKELLRYLGQNALWGVPTVVGMGMLLLDRGETRAVRLCMLAMLLGQGVTVLLLGRVWRYSLLAMAPFAVIGAMQARRLALRVGRLRNVWLRRGLALGACALSLAAAWAGTPNAYLRGQKLEDLAQGHLAAYIEPGATLLQYSHLDDGLYLTTGTLPQEKYFVRLNVQYDVMRQELDRYVREGLPDYVLVSWSELPEEFTNYQLIAVDAGYDDENRMNKAMYLYRRRSE